MWNRHHRHTEADDNPWPPFWATASWILAALALVILALGLTGIAPVPFFPGIAFGMFVLAVFCRLLNDWMFRERQSTS